MQAGPVDLCDTAMPLSQCKIKYPLLSSALHSLSSSQFSELINIGKFGGPSTIAYGFPTFTHVSLLGVCVIPYSIGF